MLENGIEKYPGHHRLIATKGWVFFSGAFVAFHAHLGLISHPNARGLAANPTIIPLSFRRLFTDGACPAFFPASQASPALFRVPTCHLLAVPLAVRQSTNPRRSTKKQQYRTTVALSETCSPDNCDKHQSTWWRNAILPWFHSRLRVPPATVSHPPNLAVIDRRIIC